MSLSDVMRRGKLYKYLYDNYIKIIVFTSWMTNYYIGIEGGGTYTYYVLL